MWNPVWNFVDSRENVFDMYGDCRENLLEFLAVVIISSPISSVCGSEWSIDGRVRDVFKIKSRARRTRTQRQILRFGYLRTWYAVHSTREMQMVELVKTWASYSLSLSPSLSLSLFLSLSASLSTSLSLSLYLSLSLSPLIACVRFLAHKSVLAHINESRVHVLSFWFLYWCVCSYVWHDSCICAWWLIRLLQTCAYVCYM